MSTLTLTIDTADYQSAEQAARLAEELTMARDHGEGIIIRTGGGKFTVDVAAALPAPAAEVIATCTAEAWTNTEQNDATTAADVAADVAQRLYTDYRVAANCDGEPGMLRRQSLDVWVAVGEFADDYNGEDPLVCVARTEHAVRVAMAAAVDEWLDGTITDDPEPHSDEQTLRDFRTEKGRADDADDVAAWLHSFRLDYDLPIFFSFELNTLDA